MCLIHTQLDFSNLLQFKLSVITMNNTVHQARQAYTALTVVPLAAEPEQYGASGTPSLHRLNRCSTGRRT